MGVPISSLPAADALTGAELLPVVQSGTTKRSTTDAIPYLPAGTGAVATTVQAKLRSFVTPIDFGAVGNGVANDRTAIQNMLTAQGTSNILIDLGGKDYYLGSVTSPGAIFVLTGCSGVTIKNPGKFLVDNNIPLSDTNVAWCSVFQFVDCEQVDVDVNVVGSAFNSDYPKGITAVEITTTKNSTKSTKYKIRSRLTNGIAALEINRPPADLAAAPLASPVYATDFVVDVGATNTEYGMRCVYNGVNLHGEINTNNVVRSYFVTDTSSHKVRVNSLNHAKFTDVLLKSYYANVSNIWVWYSGVLYSATSYAALTLEFQNDTQNTSIKNIHASIDIDGIGTNEPIILSRQFSAAGVMQSTTNSITDEIFLEVSCPQLHYVDTIHVSAKPSSGGTVYLSGRQASTSKTNGLTFVRGNEFTSMNAGSYAAGNGELAFHVAGLKVEQSCFFELELFADSDWTNASVPEAYQRWTGRLTVAADGSGSVDSVVKQDERLFNGAVAPTISFSSMTAWNLKYAVTSSDCNNANSRLIGKLKVIGGSV